MRHFVYLILTLCLFSSTLFAQNQPSGKFQTPYDAIYQHLYYSGLAEGKSKTNWIKASKAFGDQKRQDAKERAQQLKEIFEEKDLYPDFTADSSIFQRNYKNDNGESIYYPFPSELPDLYIERKGRQWFYSEKTFAAIPNMYFEVNEQPSEKFTTPYDVIFHQEHYLEEKNPATASKVFYNPINKHLPEDERVQRIRQLKEILDGKGIRIYLNLVPDNPNYIDSTTSNEVFVPFPKQLPDVYVEKYGGQWYYSKATYDAIPRLHKQVYPFGSDILLNLFPGFGQKYFLGLQIWQYIAILLLIGIGFLMQFVIVRLLRWLIEMLANTKLGKDHFDHEIVFKIARILSYLLVIYAVYVLSPVARLPVSLSAYLVVGLRGGTTLCMVILALNGIELGRSYFEHIVKKTESSSDDQLLPIFIRILKLLVLIGGVIHAFSILDINVTALIAGLSIGGLAIALAAQETVKNLIGSVMIFADKPFQIGDFIKSSDIAGTVVDIGFRSTRIKTLDTSIISVPNGALVDMVIDNLGIRDMRLFKTTVGVAYHTPPDLIEKFIEGIRKIIVLHPKTDTDRFHVYLNNMNASSLDIMVVMYFQTQDYTRELVFKEQMIFSMLRLAEALGVQIAFPSTSLYIETMPERRGLIPDYQKNVTNSKDLLNQYLEDFKQRYPVRHDEDPELRNTSGIVDDE